MKINLKSQRLEVYTYTAANVIQIGNPFGTFLRSIRKWPRLGIVGLKGQGNASVSQEKLRVTSIGKPPSSRVWSDWHSKLKLETAT
jgi:hypothetical protein